MNYTEKQIVFYGVKPTKSLRKLVEKQVERWMSRQRALLSLPRHAQYRVIIERERDLPFTTCQLRFQIGPRVWESQAVGKAAQDALFHGLHRLKPPRVSVFPEAQASELTPNVA